MAQVTTTKGWSYIKGVELQEIQAEILNSEDTDTSDLQSKPIPWKKLTNLEEVETLSFPDNCLTLDLTKHIKTGFVPLTLRLQFSIVKNYSAQVFIEDRLSSIQRESALSKFTYKSGPPITNTEQTSKMYLLEAEQEFFDEDDKNIGCKNYPTERYTSYNHCDKDFIRKFLAQVVKKIIENLSKIKLKIHQIAPQHYPKLVPIWATRNHSEVTTLYTDSHLQEGLQGLTYKGIIHGKKRSHCALPCKRTMISAR